MNRSELRALVRDADSGYRLSILNLSKSHLPQHTAQELDKDAGTGVGLARLLNYSHWGDWGWMVFYVNSYQANEARKAGHPELANLLVFAEHCGFHYLRFDSGSPELPEDCEFPTFDW